MNEKEYENWDGKMYIFAEEPPLPEHIKERLRQQGFDMDKDSNHTDNSRESQNLLRGITRVVIKGPIEASEKVKEEAGRLLQAYYEFIENCDINDEIGIEEFILR